MHWFHYGITTLALRKQIKQVGVDYISALPEFKLTAHQGTDPRDETGTEIGLYQFLRLLAPCTHHPRSLQILKSMLNLLEGLQQLL